MRQIGTLPRTTDPKVFGDYLLAQGVTSRAVESPAGWAIWVHNEDHVTKAREALAAYEHDPADPRFLAAARAAEAERKKADQLDRQYRKNYRDLSGRLDQIPLRRRPLTIALMAACVGIFVAGGISPKVRYWQLDRLEFFPIAARQQPDSKAHALDAIHRGEVWRLFTPALLHADPMHLFFNMWWLIVLGTAIETRLGTRRLLTLALVSALVSNLGQYLWVILDGHPGLRGWVGFSGVVYALFGYLWMKGVFEPEQGLGMSRSTVRIMLLWLLLGFTDVLPMANGGHVGGLLAGILFGLARF